MPHLTENLCFSPSRYQSSFWYTYPLLSCDPAHWAKETISHCVFFQLKLYLYPSQAFEVHDWYISSKTGWKTSCNPQQRQRFDWNLPQTFFLLGLPCLPSAILAAVLSLTYKEGKQEKIFCFTYKWHWNKFVEIISDMTGLVTSNKIK